MDDDEQIGGIKILRRNGKIPRKPTHTIFAHHKAYVVRVGIEPGVWTPLSFTIWYIT